MKTIRGRKSRATVPIMHKNTTYVQCTDERVRSEPQLHQGVICGDLYRNKATGDVDREANLCYFKIQWALKVYSAQKVYSVPLSMQF